MAKGLALFLLVLFLVLYVAGCASTNAPPATTTIPSTATSSPSATPPAPTATPVPPTETPLPPTVTPAPPTETPLPPTATPIPPTEVPEPTATLDPAVFELRSPAFGMEERIPVEYTCNGEDVSPPLEWGDPPTGTQSFVLVVDDISAGDLVHWVLFNVPPDTRSLREGVPKKGHLSDGSQQGTNNALKVGYFGPCPLPGPNRYRFRLWAIDTVLDLDDGVMKIPVKQAMKGHILAETELIGVFGR